MKVWVTKYALSDGRIEEMETISVHKDGLSEIAHYSGYVSHYDWGRHVHETREGAVAAAEKLRAKKIAQLENQIAKLRAMTF
jgi:hypothetical protein